jgi:diguanylate cyclase (GGDEF)-like protein/PAS domain S-box-containing protein
MSTASSSPAALVAALAVLGLVTLAVTATSARRIGAVRDRWAWTAWSVGFGLFAAAAAVATVGEGAGSAPVVDVLLAGYALVSAVGVVLRLPPGAVAIRYLGLDGTPLVLAVVSVASITYGGPIETSLHGVVHHVVVPAAFTILAGVCLHAVRYVGHARATPTARLVADGLVVTALAGASRAFMPDSAGFTTLAAVVWAIGVGAVLAGALLRARAPAANPTYTPRRDPLDGWSWAATLGVAVTILVALAHDGPGDPVRAAMATVAFASFAARATLARREASRLLADLRDAERRFRTLVEQVPLAIYTDAVDATSSTQYISPAIETLLGYTPADLESDPEWFPRVLHPDDRDRVLEAMREWHATDLPWVEEFRVIAKDGRVHWVRDEAQVIRDESGTPLNVQGFMQDVTEQRLSEQAHRAGEARKAAILDAAFDCIVTTDDHGRVVEWNAAAERTFGYARADVLGREVVDLIVPEANREAHRRGLAGGTVTTLGKPTETTALRADGSQFPVEIVIARADAGDTPMFTASIRDVTERKRAEADLRESERRYRDTLEGVNLLALHLDLDGIVTYCNDHVCAVTGWTRDELVGRSWYDTVGPVEHEESFLQSVRHDDLEDGSEEPLRTRNDGDRVILWWDTVSRDADGTIIGVNSIGQDITERRHAEGRLEFLRHHDELTGLPNRTYFTEQLGEAVGHAQAHRRAVGVVFVNLENFRVVNDAYGHAVGDAVLCQFAERLRTAAGATTLVARHGGDEFIVLLADMGEDQASNTHTHPADVAQMAAAIGGRLRHVLRPPFVHDGHELYLSARSGVAVYPTEGDGVDDILKTAHMNAYRASAVAPHGSREPGGDLAPRDELELIARMHHAIEREEFVLHYQPVIELASGAVTGAEALIRWQPPGGELVPPNSFIPLAERTGLIAPITEWVIQEVCRQTARWRGRGIEIDIGFNFPVGLWDRSTLLNMLAVMRRHGLAPDDLVIEVTESAVVNDAERSSGALDVVREHGMRLAIDDFGTGYSSLSRLAQLPASVLKLDRSFTRGLPADRDAVVLTTTIVKLAQGIGMGALAEGIEKEEQRRFLADLGCTTGQGFLFSRPVPAAAIEAMVAAERRAA